MAKMQEYLKEYIRLTGDDEVFHVKKNQIAAKAAPAPAPAPARALANKAPTTNLTTSPFQIQPSTTMINPVVPKPVTKTYKPQPSVITSNEAEEQNFSVGSLRSRNQHNNAW